MPSEKKTKWRSIRKGTSTDFSFRICVEFQKMQKFTHVVRWEGFLYVAERDAGEEVVVCTIKKHTQYISLRQGVLLNISLPMK